MLNRQTLKEWDKLFVFNIFRTSTSTICQKVIGATGQIPTDVGFRRDVTSVVQSSRLCDRGINAWCGIKDSNLSLSPCKGDTLPNELIPLLESGAEWLIRTTNILYVKEMLYR